MNFLVVHPSEIKKLTAKSFQITERHRLDSFKEEGVIVGSVRELCIVGEKRCRVVCDRVEENSSYTFSIQEEESLRPKLPCSLFIGLARPQTIKKCIHLGATAGVEEVVFVACEKGEKSYLTSKVLLPEELNAELELAIAQSGDPIPPKITIMPKFWELRDRSLHQDACKVVFHTRAKEDQQKIVRKKDQYTYIAIGPEAGWSDKEVSFLNEMGFVTSGLGSRIMRVETALGITLGSMFY